MSMQIRPQDMPEVRAELTTWNTTQGPGYFTACVAKGQQTVYHDAPNAEAAGHWFANTEDDRLAKAELFYVTREMTELVVAAARSMPTWSLAPEDLPAPRGLIYFDGLTDFRNLPTTAMTWGPCPQAVVDWCGLKSSGLWLSHYVDAGDLAHVFTRKGISAPPLLYGSESLCAFGEQESGNVSFYRDPDTRDVIESNTQDLIGRVGSLVVAKAAWLLMQQGIAECVDVSPDRAARKRLARAGHQPRPVRVIELRRPKTTSTHGDSDRQYHHRWITRGHWRQQWYPARQVHRPVWIAPHIKGPEGAPLIGGEKVYALKR
jgi:hypothetical protein